MARTARPGEAATADKTLLHFEGARFDRFPTRAFSLSHELQDHPLLTFDAVAALAEELPRTSVICDRADQALLVPEGGPPRGKETRPGERISNIRTSNSWFTLLNTEQVPAYRDLLDACLDEFQAHVVPRRGDMRRRVGFVFVSSPNSVTPAHFDIEQSLLLQIRGNKTVHVGEYADAAARQREIDRYWDGSHGRLETLPPELESFALQPGRGVFLPAIVPHWVHNGGEPSLSVTLTFFTRASQARDYVQIFNARMRRMQFRPRPPGQSATVDRAKAAIVGAYSRARGVRSGARYGTASTRRYGSS